MYQPKWTYNEERGCLITTARDFIKGYPPETIVGAGNPEAKKYGELWKKPEYRVSAPGEIFVHYFMQQVKPRHGAQVIDFGCGTGRGALRLFKMGMKVTMVDFVRNCLDESVFGHLSENFKFIKHDLEKPIPVIGEYGYCTDVMEHIPPDKVETTLENILRSAKQCFFAISTVKDVCGSLVGMDLHLTIQPYEWWLKKFQEMSCVVHWSEKIGSYGFFHVTAWEGAQTLVDHGTINTTEQQILENVKFNCAQGYRQVIPHPTQETEVMILGGGYTLPGFEEDILEKRKQGIKLITLNGTYNWAIERGFTPSAQVIVDARDFNARFTKPVIQDCKYLLASQCHPSVFEGIPKEQIYLWHVLGEVGTEDILKHYPTCWPVPGGSTVFLRAIPLLRMLGFYRFHVYGCDSCITNGVHHAYSQKENDGQTILPIMVTGGEIFYCHPWMAAQAREFITLVEKIGDTFDMVVYGDGLLAHILNTGARLCPGED